MSHSAKFSKIFAQEVPKWLQATDFIEEPPTNNFKSKGSSSLIFWLYEL